MQRCFRDMKNICKKVLQVGLANFLKVNKTFYNHTGSAKDDFKHFANDFVIGIIFSKRLLKFPK